jgi:hypothetical protein
MHDFSRSTNVFLCSKLPDDVFVYDGPSSHRVLPSSLGGHNSANNTELANINDMQARPNLENRIMDPDERAVYQEALQVCIFWSIESEITYISFSVMCFPFVKTQNYTR